MNFQTLLQELESSTSVIRSLLNGLTEEEARFKPKPETWSILEVICHLYDEEREDFREHLDFILHRQGQEWHPIDPKGWVTARKYNDQNFGGMQEKFFAERRKSIDWLGGLADADWETTYASQFGSLSAGDMLASWIAHDNLHIRQLVELRRARIEQITKPCAVIYAGDWQ